MQRFVINNAVFASVNISFAQRHDDSKGVFKKEYIYQYSMDKG